MILRCQADHRKPDVDKTWGCSIRRVIEMPGNSLINLGDLSKPANTLIKKISDAVGGIFKPYQIVRVAKAEAEGERIRAECQIEITDIQRRAFFRWLEEEGKKQSNIEEITNRALPLLDEKSEPQKVEDDWITNFFDKCRIVSNKEMQALWSRVLAQEANKPGTVSKRTVNLLGDLDKSDAELFKNLCCFCWNFGTPTPVIFGCQEPIYNRFGINFQSLNHLETLGMIKFNDLTGFVIQGSDLPGKFVVQYFGKPLILELTPTCNNRIDIGKVMLSHSGMELAPICGAASVEGFFDFVSKEWANRGFITRVL